MKKVLAIALVLVMVFSMVACGKEEVKEPQVDFTKSAGTMTYDEYVAAAEGTTVVIEGFVQAAAYNSKYGNVNLFVQDDKGAYYVYRAACDDALAAKLVAGAKVKVTGEKSSWSGEVEIAEGTGVIEVLDGVPYVAPAKDITSTLANVEELIKLQNQVVSLKDVKVVASTIQDDPAEYAFLYNWNGSGEKGSNSDVYFNGEVNGTVYSFVVESDECPEGTAVYTSVENLKVGDTVDLEGLLYWYNGPEVHVHGVIVKL